MGLARKLGSRFALLAGGRVAVLVLGLLATALLTRFLGPDGFGHFRTAVSVLAAPGIDRVRAGPLDAPKRR